MSVGDSATNVALTKSLLRPALLELGVEVDTVMPASQGGYFDELKVAEEAGIPAGLETWAQLFANADYRNYEGLEELASADLVIGWGLPPSLVNFLAHIQKTFIDFELSPIRFCESLFMKVRTNDVFIHQLLARFQPSEQDLFLSAQKLAVSYTRQPISFPRTSWGFFLGQTQVDAALIQEGILRKPSEPSLLSEISALAESIDFLGVVAHPNAPDIAHLLPVLRHVSNAVMVPGVAYEYLARDNTQFVTSLSSGVISEARFFGVEAYSLINPDIRNSEKYVNEIFETESVDTRVFNVDLWRQVFERNGQEQLALVGDVDLITPVFAGFSGRNFGQSAFTEPLKPISCTGLINNVIGDDRVVLAHGWHELEHEDVWSNGAVASLFLRVGRHQKVKLGVYGTRYWPLNFVATEVTLEVVGANSETRALEPTTAGFAEEFFIRATASGLISVQFFVRNPFSPWQAGESDDRRKLGVWLQGVSVSPPSEDDFVSGIPDNAYYQAFHTYDSSYQDNNWLSPFSSFLRKFGFRKVVECGTGNGSFIGAMGDSEVQAVGLDWAASPIFPHSAEGVSFLAWNALTDPIPPGDLCCSGDFLEHLHPDRLNEVLSKMTEAAPFQFHLIACYDDGHSHLSVLSPQDWLSRFQRAMKVVETGVKSSFEVIEIRRGKERKSIIVTNLPGVRQLVSGTSKKLIPGFRKRMGHE